jgi:hypothetical protein
MDEQKRSQNELAHWNSYQRAFCLATEGRGSSYSSRSAEFSLTGAAAHLAATLRKFAPMIR